MDKINKSKNRLTKKVTKNEINNENRIEKQNKDKERKDKKIERSKKEKYSTISSQTVLKEMKNSALSSIQNFRNTFDNLSQRLKLSTNRPINRSTDSGNSYEQLSVCQTPIQMYSPFGIETPSPRPTKRSKVKRHLLLPYDQLSENDI
ncbi:uncharacterized protein LOC128963256 [Oppia nitens]|uniref:uncharacterized protein LOC128963256 n=1 Tax=Oppia nitens TaxID=1686743 RepID=UPI0023DB7BD6|nr:uncharacterized protein LOC128963256 [Oppia nitens]